MIEIVFCVGWIYVYRARRTPMQPVGFLTTWPMLAVWGFTLAFFAGAAWYCLRQRRQLRHLAGLERGLAAGGAARTPGAGDRRRTAGPTRRPLRRRPARV